MRSPSSKHFAFALVTTLAVVACGSPQSPPPANESAPTSSSAEASPSAAPPGASSVEAPRKKRPLEVYSACTDVVTVVFSEDPKAAGAGKRTIAPSASIDAPRENDGTQTIWLLDPKDEPLVKVHVTRGMKRVEVGKSCRTLDAR